jgi:hypothetical protein
MEDVLREYKLQNYAKRLGQEAKPNVQAAHRLKSSNCRAKVEKGNKV